MRMCYPSQVNAATYTRMKPHTYFTLYRYGIWSKLIPVGTFCTATRTGVNSYRYYISYQYHVNEYRATCGNRDELVLE